jgi:hypothetical protein
MAAPQALDRKRHRDYGDGGISWDKTNNCFVGRISLGFDSDGKRLRRSVRGRTKAVGRSWRREVAAKLSAPSRGAGAVGEGAGSAGRDAVRVRAAAPRPWGCASVLPASP